MNLIYIGKIITTHGLKGEIKIRSNFKYIDKNIDNYLISKKAEKCVVFADFDPIEEVENLVNHYIKLELDVTKKQMNKQEAIDLGAEAMFIEKYGDVVTVYFIGDISKELCGGPHVSNTKELGHFKIVKEEASSSGVRRIKAILE